MGIPQTQSFFSTLIRSRPNNTQNAILENYSHIATSEGKSTQYTGGSVLCCDPTTNSEVRQGNCRFWGPMDKDMIGQVWRTIKQMGV